MSTATDILGKVGEKVGSEIKNIKDNYATKVSLGNVSSTIDFSPYATVVSLGVVDQKIENLDLSPYSTKVSLAAYADGSSTFSNLKASRAEVDELIVKGDTTIVNTQTVEVSDNMIEVNLAADGNITTNTGGIAVNRGINAGTYVQDTDIATSVTAANSESIGGGEYAITELGTSYKPTAQFPGSEFIKNYTAGSDFSLTQVYNAPANVDYALGPSNIPDWTNYRFAPTGAFSGYTGDSYYAGSYYSGDYVIEPWVFDANAFQFSQFTEDGTTMDVPPGAVFRYWPKYLKARTTHSWAEDYMSPHVTYEIGFKTFPGDTNGTIYYKRMDDTAGAANDYYKPVTAGDYDGNWEIRYSTDENAAFVHNTSPFQGTMEPVPFVEKTYISSFGSGDSKVPYEPADEPVSFSDEPFELGTGDWHNFQHSNGDAYYWGSSFTNSTYNQTIQVLQSTTDGSGDIRFRVDGSNVGSCNYKGELYRQTGTSGYSDISVTWSNQGTHYEIESVTVTYSEPEGGGSSPEDTTGNLTEDADTPKSYTIQTAVYNGIIQSRFKTAWSTRERGSGNQLDLGDATIATYSEAGAALPDAELVWNQDLDAWSFSKDGSGSKIFYSNIFPSASDLPSASTYHGMFAHVHDTGRGYFAHGGAWKELFDTSAGQTVTGNIDVSAGSALKVADSSGIKINNIDLGNYASFETALILAVDGPPSVTAGAGVTSDSIEIIPNESSINPDVHVNRFSFVKDGKLHVYDGTASSSSGMWTVNHNFATPYRMYVDRNYTLNTSLSDSGITETYGGFESVMAWDRYVPRYFYISSNSALAAEADKTSEQNDMSAYTGPVLTIDPFRLLWPDFEPAYDQQHSPFDA